MSAALYNYCIFMIHSVYILFAETGVLEGFDFFFHLGSSLRRGKFRYGMSDLVIFRCIDRKDSISYNRLL